MIGFNIKFYHKNNIENNTTNKILFNVSYIYIYIYILPFRYNNYVDKFGSYNNMCLTNYNTIIHIIMTLVMINIIL